MLNEPRLAPDDAAPLGAASQKSRNEPTLRCALRACTDYLGADLSQIHGLGPYTVLRLVAECGDDMTKWPTAKHFTSWLCLAPANKISGGRVLSSKTRRSSNRAAALLRIAAVNVGRTQTALGAFYRRLAARIGKGTGRDRHRAQARGPLLQGPPLRHDVRRPGRLLYEARYRQRVLHNLQRRAKSLGFTLVSAKAACGGSFLGNGTRRRTTPARRRG